MDPHFRFSDPSVLRQQSAAYGWDMRHTRLGAGSLGVSAWATEQADLVLYREYFEFAVLARGTSAPDAFSILTIQQGSLLLYGEVIDRQRVGLLPLGASVEAVGSADLETFHVQVAGDRLLAEARKAGVRLIRSERAFCVTPGLDRIRRLRRVMEEANKILDRDDRAAWSKVEADLLALLLALFDEKTIDGLKLPGSVATGAVHAMEARRLVDLRLPDGLNLVGLADDLAISRRHLNRCFRDYYGISLKEYIHISRLHEARNLLRRPSREVNVTEAAHACGFEHLGRFSAQYKRLFGESPSQTLREAHRLV